MFWGSKNDTLDETRHSIAQPPPTPGLASWAFNSLFNRQTPSSKYAEIAREKKESKISKDEFIDNKDDTFYRRKNQRARLNRRSNDDISLNTTSNKNVAWGSNEFKIRTRSSSFSEIPNPKISDYLKNNELLPDVNDEDFDFSKRDRYSIPSYAQRQSLPKSYSSSKFENPSHISLPPAFPGKFPSPYVQRESSPLNSSNNFPEILTSSASKNLKAAHYNTEKNRKLAIGSPPNKKPVSLPRDYSRGSHSKNGYDDNDLIDALDQNIMDLNNITRSIERLKVDGAADSSKKYKELQKKYEDVKQELINEFRKSKKMYDSYYKFLDKYKDLKQDYNLLSKKSEISESVPSLKKEIRLLQEENMLLQKKVEISEKKISDDDTEVFNLKSTLQNSSKFEGTLRRKIKYLEDKMEDDRLEFKKERFQLNEKIFLLESKLKDEEELYQSDLKRARENIKELERKLNGRSSYKNLSLIPEYNTDETKNQKRRSYDKNDKNNDILDYLNERFPDKQERKDETRRNRRPTSLQMPSGYKFSDLRNDIPYSTRFSKPDESTNTLDFKRLSPTANDSPYPFRNRHVNNSYPDLSLNPSEI